MKRPDSIDATLALLASQDYVADRRLATAIFLALRLQRPLFVEGFSASTDVFNRAAPLLGLVFIGEILGAGNLDWSWWQNLLAGHADPFPLDIGT